ncbi:flagellar hook-associated protein FlgK [Clostridiales bacterium COT073_COT-073]|nr:flagellar hook-associated protein FlgK [Clostridiales bacterium COT073_COT-073]
MRSSFFGINVAQQGLFAARGNLDVINHNLSNSSVAGYSRQYAIQKASRPMRNLHRGMVGTGAELVTVDQHRSHYLDVKFRSFNRDLGEYKTKNEFLDQMELLFKEPYSEGLSTNLDQLYAGLKALTTSPTEDAARTKVVQLLRGLTDAVNDVSKRLRMLQNDLNFEIKGMANRINGYAEQIAALNRQIEDSELHGHKANDLRDQRNRLLDELSQIVPVTSREEVDALGQKTFHVSINGAQLVHGSVASYLEIRTRTNLSNPEDNAGLYDIYWKTGQKLNVTASSFTGALKGLFVLRDGANSFNFRGQVESIPGAMSLKIKNVNRFDLPKSGSFTVQGEVVEYESYVVNQATKEIEFKLKNPAAAGLNGKYAIMGDDINFRGIPYYLGRLNEFSRIYASKMNAIHQKGKAETGLPLFVGAGNLSGKIVDPAAGGGHTITIAVDQDAVILSKGKLTIHGQEIEYTSVTDAVEVTLPDGSKQMRRTFTLQTPLAPTDSRLTEGAVVRVQDLSGDNITVNPEIANNLQKLETYYSAQALGNVSDTALLQDLISLRQNTHFFDRGTPDNFVQAYMGELGIDKAQAESFKKGSQDLIRLVEKQRMSVSGVNRDEEIAEMTAYLHVYQYSAKAMSVFDQIYETTINLGR